MSCRKLLLMNCMIRCLASGKPPMCSFLFKKFGYKKKKKKKFSNICGNRSADSKWIFQIIDVNLLILVKLSTNAKYLFIYLFYKANKDFTVNFTIIHMT